MTRVSRKLYRLQIGLVIANIIWVAGCGDTNAPAGGERVDIAADLVLRNAAVYTLVPEQPWATAIAVADGEIVFVGNETDVGTYVSDETQVFDLDGKMVLPGLHDSHVHALSSQLRKGGLEILPSDDAKTALQKIRAYAESHPDDNVIAGGTVGLDEDLNRDLLDAIDDSRAIIIGQDGGHSLWVNSFALEASGIDDNSPNPQGGMIVRDENGRATGSLIDAAMNAVSGLYASARPTYNDEQRRQAAREVQAWFNSFGITSIKELHGGIDHLETYKSLIDKGELTIRVSQHLTMRPQTAEQEAAFYEFLEGRDQYRSEQLNPDFIKMNMDGIPGTMYMLENYAGNNNTPLIDPEVLKQRFIKLDAMGMTVAVHSHGDASIRAVLDAVEAAREANGPNGVVHQNAHTSTPHPDDLPRFRELDVVAEISPHAWYPNDTYDWVASVVPAWIVENTFPARWFVDAGAVLAVGSDWDSNTVTVNPFQSMESLVTRKDPYGARPDERLGIVEGLTVAEAIAAYTTGGAYAARRDDLGAIKAGMRADLAVLDRNLLEIPVEEISDTKAIYTFLDGRLVYEAER